MACEKPVAKSAFALRCFHCDVWMHVGCGDLTIGDYDFMKERQSFGFRWFCSDCLKCLSGPGPRVITRTLAEAGEAVAAKVASAVAQQLQDFQGEVTGRLEALEAKVSPVITPPQFSDILKRTLGEQDGVKTGDKGVKIST